MNDTELEQFQLAATLAAEIYRRDTKDTSIDVEGDLGMH